jgi:Protein of unknown function (DUF3396)
LTTQFAVEKGGIKCINWLTFLNAVHVERLGGVERLKRDLGADVPVRSLEGGVMVQAGPQPQIGDVNRQQDLPLYRRVGRVLAPVRSREHPAFLRREGVPSREATQKWLSRFDR